MARNAATHWQPLLITGVRVEKVQFPPKSPKLGGYKMPRKLRKSFVGHPSAILFLQISRAGVFQQPQALSQLCTFVRQTGEGKAQTCAIEMLRQLTRRVAEILDDHPL